MKCFRGFMLEIVPTIVSNRLRNMGEWVFFYFVLDYIIRIYILVIVCMGEGYKRILL